VSLVAERRFARRSLAVWLDQRGVPYERFDDLRDVARALEAQGRGEGAGDGRGG
jgi:hypothetical protein